MKRDVLIAGAYPRQLEPYACHMRTLGFSVCFADSLPAVCEALEGQVFRLVILDLTTLPETDFQFISELRRMQTLPILALASTPGTSELGVDYTVSAELPCRQAVSYGAALMHQYQSNGDDFLEASETGKFPIARGDFFLDQWEGWVTVKKEFIQLSPELCGLLAFFLQNAGRLITDQELNRMLWYSDAAASWDDDVLVNVLRFKIERNPEKPAYIRTVPDMGYRFFVRSEAC